MRTLRRWIAIGMVLAALVACDTADDFGDAFTLTSDAFENNGAIPAKHTCDGADKSPSLYWTNVPGGTEAFAVTVRDPDSPSGDTKHWIIVNIPAGFDHLGEGADPPMGATQVESDMDSADYRGPCPPEGDGPHRYIFTLYALDAELADMAADTPYDEVIAAVESAAIDSAALTGIYKR